jgi:hypothetical protein
MQSPTFNQENHMKLKFIAHMLLIDCGKASKATRGTFNGPISEVAQPPLNHWG